jgi:peptide/nickel transport system substrate-binding protein
MHSEGIENDRKGFLLERAGLCVVIVLLSILLTACGEEFPTAGSNVGAGANPAETVEPESLSTPMIEMGIDEQELIEESLEGTVDDEVITEATITPEVDRQLVVCLGGMPVSLFPFGDDSITAIGLRHAIYESLYTSVGFDYQAQGLKKLPSLADGDVVIKTVMVEEGDRVKDVDGNVVVLVKDVIVLNSAGEEITFDGTPVEMEQMVVEFSFRPMIWSDGTPVTAQDSVFSFNLASDPQTVIGKNGQANTESYEATGDRSVRWTGLPGHMDQTYFLNVWLPLPSHQLAEKTMDELKTAEETIRMPLSSGPFVISEWTEEDYLVLSRNDHYYRQDEGLSNLDRIIVRFGNGEDFLANDSADSCDVITNGAMNAGILPLLETAAEKGEWDVLTSSGSVFEHIAFGIDPVQEYGDRRPDWFEDTRVRQAVTMCTDRQRMVEELTDGRAELLHAYVPEGHRLFPDDLTKWPYDPEQANKLLDKAGYLDFSEDGRRQDVSSGIPMTITLGTNSESSLRLSITDIFQENMADCGIPVETYDFPAGTWFAEGPVGRVFGRRFDLAEFAWIGKALPDCGLYLSENITGPEEGGYGGWQNTNVTGWSSEEFDAACLAALDAMPAGAGYDENQREALRIFARELPAIPLFTNIRVAAVRPWIKNVKLDPSQPSLLWNIFEWCIEH